MMFYKIEDACYHNILLLAIFSETVSVDMNV